MERRSGGREGKPSLAVFTLKPQLCVCVYFTMNHAILICPVKQLPSAAQIAYKVVKV